MHHSQPGFFSTLRLTTASNTLFCSPSTNVALRMPAAWAVCGCLEYMHPDCKLHRVLCGGGAPSTWPMPAEKAGRILCHCTCASIHSAWLRRHIYCPIRNIIGLPVTWFTSLTHCSGPGCDCRGLPVFGA